MSGVLFSDSNKSILFDIADYEFRYLKEWDFFDSNWLTVNVKYSYGDVNKTFVDSCILTYELNDLLQKIDGIIAGKESDLITDFMEPYLQFSVMRRENMYIVQICYVYDSRDDWKDICVSQELDKNGLVRMRDELEKLCKEFPIRTM